MISITKEQADHLLQTLEGFRQSAGAPAGSLDRIAQGIRILAGEPKGGDDYQRPAFYLPGLTSRPYWDSSQFACAAKLESASGIIREEVLGLREQPVFKAEPEADLVTAGTWAQFELALAGRMIEENCARAPRTAKVLGELEEAQDCDFMMFSANVPGTHLRPHCGTTNTRLRCHLGLIVPEGCSMRVRTEVRPWEEGKCLIFDDSFEHEVWNQGTGTRVILLVDIWHPEVTPIERLVIQQLAGQFRSVALNKEEDLARADRRAYSEQHAGETLAKEWWV
jgi:aspartyl/asparaginyl beta-hydroxylase (cupin superfamily)